MKQPTLAKRGVNVDYQLRSCLAERSVVNGITSSAERKEQRVVEGTTLDGVFERGGGEGQVVLTGLNLVRWHHTEALGGEALEVTRHADGRRDADHRLHPVAELDGGVEPRRAPVGGVQDGGDRAVGRGRVVGGDGVRPVDVCHIVRHAGVCQVNADGVDHVDGPATPPRLAPAAVGSGVAHHPADGHLDAARPRRHNDRAAGDGAG